MKLPEQLNSSLSGRYALEREIGSGGMATVYLARDIKHNRNVALKVLRPELAAALGAKRFLTEIEVTANLQHPHILPLFDSGEANSLPYYVMPYVEGETLRQRLERERQLPIDDAIRIAAGVASALDYAHRQGVIHRDLKPENILLHEGDALVADFGIALAVSNVGGARLTETGISVGTPQYMSPEQATGDAPVDGRSDIHSLGVVLYEMLVGEPPFLGRSVQAIVAQILSARPTHPRALRETVPEHVDAAVMRALARMPVDRFATAAEFARALTAPLTVARDQSSTLRGHASSIADSLAIGAASEAVPPQSERDRQTPAPLATAHSRKPWPRRAVVSLAGMLIVASAFVAPRWWRAESDVTLSNAPARLITTLPGLETDPEVSPTGDRVVFAWAEAPGEKRHLFLVSSRGGNRIRLTERDGEDGYPSWSPDGSEIAFLRSYEGGRFVYPGQDGCCRTDVMVVPAIPGGPARRVASSSWGQGLDWSPDGKLLAFSDRPRPNLPLRIFLLSIATGERTQFTVEPKDGKVLHDTDPAFSRDGRSIAFVRRGSNSGGSGQLHVQAIHGDGSTTPLTTEGFVWDVDWAPRQDVLLFATGAFSSPYLASVPLTGAQPKILPAASGASQFSISRATGALVYAEYFQDHDIWKIPGPTATAPGAPEKLINSTRDEFSPDISPDGKRLTFISQRSGEWEVWVAGADGGNERQLTDLGHAIFPRWSPDGQKILFSSITTRKPGAISDVYYVDADGGGYARNVTVDDEKDAIPSWSPDGAWIYFQSRQDNEAGSGWQLWRKRFPGGPSELVLPRSVLRPVIAANSEILYYVFGKGILSTTRGDSALVGGDKVSFFTEWTVWKNTLVYVQHSDSLSTIESLDIVTGEAKRIASLPREFKRPLLPPGSTLSVSLDGRWIALTVLRDFGSDIRLLEGKR